MHTHIADLVRSATDGNQQALIALIAMAVGTNAFLSRRAAKELWDHFKIRTLDQ